MRYGILAKRFIAPREESDGRLAQQLLFIEVGLATFDQFPVVLMNLMLIDYLGIDFSLYQVCL